MSRSSEPTHALPPLVVPAGVQIFATEEGIALGNIGDVSATGPLPVRLGRLFSLEGSVTLRSRDPVSVTRIEASHGVVTLAGNISAQTIVARRVIQESGSLNVKELVADEFISLQGDALQADIVFAPAVALGKGLRGRATVVESKNDIGPSLIKGVFRLEEYLDIFPQGQNWLDQYPTVLSRMSDWKDVTLPESYTASLGEVTVEVEDPPALTLGAAADSGGIKDAGTPEANLSEPHPMAGTEDRSGSEARSEVLPAGESSAGSIDSNGHSHPVLNPELVEELYGRLSEGVLKILGRYPDDRLPPPIQTLKSLVEGRNFPELKMRLTGLWNDLIQFHKKEGLDMSNAVVHNIHEMRKLLQEKA